MPRADAERVAAFAAWRTLVARAEVDLAARLDAERHQELSTYTILEVLVAAGGTMRMHELADALVLGRPTVTRMIDRLEYLGLVDRHRDENDGRAVYVRLSRAGREEFRRCQPAYERGLHDVLGRHLTDADVAALQRVAARLNGG